MAIKEKRKPWRQLRDNLPRTSITEVCPSGRFVPVSYTHLLGQGKSNLEIARQLHLSVATVSTHCTQIQKKLNLKCLNALIRYAVCWAETAPA